MGHTLGACGALEAWISIGMMNEGWLDKDHVEEQVQLYACTPREPHQLLLCVAFALTLMGLLHVGQDLHRLILQLFL